MRRCRNIQTILAACLLLAGWTPVLAAEERTPEQLLPSTTQAFVRWDGVTAHKDAYANSARGKILAGETGKLFEELIEVLHRQMKLSLVGEPLLQGNPPGELQKVRADLRAVRRLPDLLMQTGIVAGFELAPPAADLPNFWKAFKGDAAANAQLRTPQYQLTLVIPDAADKQEFLAAIRLLMQNNKDSMKERVVLGRKVTIFSSEVRKKPGREPVPLIVKSGVGGIPPLPPPEIKPDKVAVPELQRETLTAWAEGKHFVIVFSNYPVEKAVERIKDAGVGVTENPLYKKLGGFKEFGVVTRGFVDVGKLKGRFEKLARVAAPEAWLAIEQLGLTSIESASFWDGFEGEESRGVIEISFTKERCGLTRMFRPMKEPGEVKVARPRPLRPEDLPPLPADLTRFTAARWDLATVYDFAPLFGLVLADRDKDGKAPTPDEWLKQRKEDALEKIDEALGIKTAEFLNALDDKVVTYQAPGDGLFALGQVIAVGVKDEKTVQRCLDGLARKLEAESLAPLVMKRRDCLGVEVREFVIKSNSPVTVSCAICDGWLVIAPQPQPVRGFIYRMKGKLPKWQPDARTAATLAKVSADRCVLQVSDPRPNIQLLLGAAPVVAGLLNFGDKKEPILQPGLMPHAGEVSQHLFPNVMWCQDDGKTMRWESRDSLWLPVDFLGLDPVLMLLLAQTVS